MASPLFSPLRLPSGSVLSNRVARRRRRRTWLARVSCPIGSCSSCTGVGAPGAGLLITGNVMVHAEALTGPAGAVFDDAAPLEPFAKWARAGRPGGAAAWMQVNHPGRLVEADMPGVVWGPSAGGVDIGRQSDWFGVPVAMTAEQISDTVERFAVTAARAEQAGFDGVEVHAAHGYLLSQFLSPLVNRRTDEWGGSLEKRARLLLDVVRAVRAADSPTVAGVVKLNSADLQRGGFDADDARRVIEWLEPLGVDLSSCPVAATRAPP